MKKYMSQKREAKFTLQFRHWLKKNPMMSGAFELKQSITNSLPFSAVREHQVDALLATNSDKGLLWKIPDDSISSKPYDLFYLRNAGAWVVIKYPDCFCIININLFLEEKTCSLRKSLTSSRAKEIATVVVATSS